MTNLSRVLAGYGIILPAALIWLSAPALADFGILPDWIFLLTTIVFIAAMLIGQRIQKCGTCGRPILQSPWRLYAPFPIWGACPRCKTPLRSAPPKPEDHF